jgi:hypothetical protein
MTKGKHGKFNVGMVLVTIVIDLLLWMVLQWIGEQLKFLPVIYLQMPTGSAFTESEGLLLFVVVIGLSSFLASLIVWLVARKRK